MMDLPTEVLAVKLTFRTHRGGKLQALNDSKSYLHHLLFFRFFEIPLAGEAELFMLEPQEYLHILISRRKHVSLR
jgi:hypothetical protein